MTNPNFVSRKIKRQHPDNRAMLALE